MGSAAGLTAAGPKGCTPRPSATWVMTGSRGNPGLVVLVARGGQVHFEALGRLAVVGAAGGP